jgi:hypothetical protein
MWIRVDGKMTAVKVKVGSPCFLKYQGKVYRAGIREIRGKSKMFLVAFQKDGTERQVWKHGRELQPATNEDAEPMVVRILDPPAETPGNS